MFVVHRSGLLGEKKKKSKRCNTQRAGRLFGSWGVFLRSESVRLVEESSRGHPRRTALHPAPDINRQHFDIARLLVYLSRSFLQNKENGFDKKIRNVREHLRVLIISRKVTLSPSSSFDPFAFKL